MKQIGQAKALMRATIEEVGDARTIERVKKANGNKPSVPWSQMKKEFDWLRSREVEQEVLNILDEPQSR